MAEGSNNAGNVITWIEKISGFMSKIGFHNVLLTVLIVFIAIVVGNFAFNPEIFANKIKEVQEQQHALSIQKRMDASPKIRATMVELQRELGCDRVYILETHNGGNNLAGLPFVYVDLTYAEPNHENYWLEDEYKNVRLSRYPWATKLYDTQSWVGSIDDMKPVDEELYYRLDKENVGYMAATMMYGEKNPIGVLGIVFEKGKNPDPKAVKAAMVKYSGMLTTLLNND